MTATIPTLIVVLVPVAVLTVMFAVAFHLAWERWVTPWAMRRAVCNRFGHQWRDGRCKTCGAEEQCPCCICWVCGEKFPVCACVRTEGS